MSDWIDVGPGAATGEVLRVKNFANGTLVAAVKQTKGYKPRSVTNMDPRDEIVVLSEQTISISFLPGVRMELTPVSSTESEVASPQAPSPEPGTASLAPAPVGALPPK